MKEELLQVGLTYNETEVYLSLLELGPSNAGAITKKCGLHRRVVYDILERLIKKGLIGYIIKNGVRLFTAADPDRIMEILKEREQAFSQVLPDMKLLYRKTREKEETNFYKGKRGLKTVFEDQLNYGKEVLILGASPLAYEVLEFYFKWYDKRRKEKKMKVRAIFQKTKKKLNVPYSEIRYLPEKYSSPLAINIYGDKIALILWNKENPLAIVVKNELFAYSYRKYFELIWRIARKE